MIPFASLALAASLSSPEASVTIPWNDFEALYRKYAQLDPQAPTAPRAWTLDRAVYAGTIVGDGDDAYALVHLSLRGEVHQPRGWTTIPLLSASAALRSAKIDGKDAAIFVADGQYTLVRDRAGPFDAELEFAVRLFAADGESGFNLPLAASGATVVALRVPTTEPLTFEIPGAQGTDVSHTATDWRVEAWVPAQPALSVAWKRAPKETPTEQVEPRVYAETQTLVGVGEGAVEVTAKIDYTVLHHGVDHLAVRLPADVTVLDVVGNGIRAWTMKDGLVDVALNYEALGGYHLAVQYERALAAGTRDLPLPTVPGVARETDWIGVDARSALELVAGTPSGAVPVDVRELPASLVGATDYPVLLGFRARGGDVKVPLEVRQHPSIDMLVTLVDTASASTLVTPDGRRMTRVVYAVRNNRKQFLRVSLPETAEVWSATVAGRGVKVAKAEGGVLVPLVRSDASGGALSAFSVELVYVEKGEALATGAGSLRVALPRVDAPSSLLQWSVYVPDTLRVAKKGMDGSVRAVAFYSAAPVLPDDAPPEPYAQELAAEVQRQAAPGGSLAQGVEPVEVAVPLTGQALTFEKMLVLDEELWVSFAYRNRARR